MQNAFAKACLGDGADVSALRRSGDVHWPWHETLAAIISGRSAGDRPGGANRRQTLKVLITGGSGFIGSHLADAYLAAGDDVFVIDDLSTGSIENIRHLKEHPRFHYTVDSVQNQPVLAELIDTCDVVFHLAAAVGVKLVVESPVQTIEMNI